VGGVAVDPAPREAALSTALDAENPRAHPSPPGEVDPDGRREGRDRLSRRRAPVRHESPKGARTGSGSEAESGIREDVDPLGAAVRANGRSQHDGLLVHLLRVLLAWPGAAPGPSSSETDRAQFRRRSRAARCPLTGGRSSRFPSHRLASSPGSTPKAARVTPCPRARRAPASRGGAGRLHPHGSRRGALAIATRCEATRRPRCGLTSRAPGTPCRECSPSPLVVRTNPLTRTRAGAKRPRIGPSLSASIGPRSLRVTLANPSSASAKTNRGSRRAFAERCGRARG